MSVVCAGRAFTKNPITFRSGFCMAYFGNLKEVGYDFPGAA